MIIYILLSLYEKIVEKNIIKFFVKLLSFVIKNKKAFS